ncbi:MAG: AMP-binding protein [Granulosicoccaceae bacterium]
MPTPTRVLPPLYDSLKNRMGDRANYVPLTPMAYLSRTADVHPQLTSLVYEERRYTWSQTEARCQAMAAALKALGLQAHQTVSLLAFNTPEMFEAHFYVPLAGGVLNTINTRLDAETVSYILEFAETSVLIVDRELLPVALEGIRACTKRGKHLQLILIDDTHAASQPELPHDIELFSYENLLQQYAVEKADYLPATVEDELHPLAINFTSGTSGRPKGVVYHHRGSYLMTMGTISGWAVPRHPRYLYTVPMFHCNGWGHAWTMTAMAATVVCVRAIVPERIFELMQQWDITHFGGAPIVLNMLANAPTAPERIHPDKKVYCMTAGAPPPAAVLARMAGMGCEVMHVYGLTETYGHILQAEPQPAWQHLAGEELAQLQSRQGVRFPMMEQVQVLDGDTGAPVAPDGEQMGEIVIRGNAVMTGYLKNQEATDEALKDGWFWSGDLAVVHPDGYIQIKDRAKDIIISGGENISSVEIENVLYTHPAVGEAAVVAMPDDKWGESPCAFIELKAGAESTEEEIVEHCLEHMARFKRPKKVVFGPLPKTATGKIQKFELRKVAKG